MSLQKNIRYKNKKYTDWVKSQPSCISCRPADDPHHIKGRGYGGTGKRSDILTIPLTRDEHTEFHNIGWETWEKKYNVDQRDLVLDTINLATNAGWEFKK